MELNSKRLERTSRIIYFFISATLCMFLILLSGRIIDDLDNTTKRPSPKDFENRILLEELLAKIQNYDSELLTLHSKQETIDQTIATAQSNYDSEKQSFDNWLATRKTLGSPVEDVEVVKRAEKLDEFLKVREEWRLALNELKDEIEAIRTEQSEVKKEIYKEESRAEKQYLKELKWYDLKVFLIRLLFVAPVLALGLFFFIKRRKSKFWPLYFGFTLFSLYAFFFGLVPYLPSYGGYVRYIVGIALSGGIGYYAIKRIRTFIENKKAELQTSTEERAKKVHTETAEKALQNHFCPSCGKDFIMKNWEFPHAKDLPSNAYKLVTSFCRHCGLELFKNCENCDHKNFAHLPYCSSCGTKTAAEQ